ncbi:MAG TPA: T9SS type A sorting domain-containing protein [candidate division Zixibacteria bacterium]|nr:T9SS type A sorting domain-containing protein [candidate division Zixibacteria bacterium]
MKKIMVSVGFFLLALTSLSFSQPVFAPPVNLGPKINTPSTEADPFLTADGKKLFYSNGVDIWFSEMTDTGWTNGKRLGPQINYSIFFQRDPSVSPDGQKLYYIDAERDGYNWDIWVSTWDSSLSDWGAPQNLGPSVNTPGDEFSAQISPDGRHLYFTSYYFNLRCGMYVSEWDGSGWSQPVYLGDNVSCGSEEHPSITADGLWLYLDKYVGGATQSVFVSTWTDSGWSQPIDLRDRLGSHGVAPFITPSADSLFFATSELGGYGGPDIFVAEVIATDVPEPPKSVPRSFELYQNYPNPFNSQTKIKFFVSRSLNGLISVKIYNILGAPVRHLIREEVIYGQKEIEWDGIDDWGRQVGSGIYFIQLKIGDKSAVKKAILLK